MVKNIKTEREIAEAAILEHLKAIRAISKAYGTKSYLSLCYIDRGAPDGVCYMFNNEHFDSTLDSEHPIDFIKYIHEPDEYKPEEVEHIATVDIPEQDDEGDYHVDADGGYHVDDGGYHGDDD